MRTHTGYSIIEVVVIVAVFLVFAVAVTPRFSAASDNAMRTAVEGQLKAIEQQVAAYRADHEGGLPELGGEQDSGWAALVDGGYFAEPPINAYVRRARVQATDASPKLLKADESPQNAAFGWFYHPAHGVVIANGFDHVARVFHMEDDYSPARYGW